MDKDRIKGSAEQAKGAVKETAGKILAIRSWKPMARPTSCRQSAKRDRWI